MDLSNFAIFLDGAKTMDGQPVEIKQQADNVNAEVQQPDNNAAAAQGGGGVMGIGGIVLYIVGLIALFYFFCY